MFIATWAKTHEERGLEQHYDIKSAVLCFFPEKALSDSLRNDDITNHFRSHLVLIDVVIILDAHETRSKTSGLCFCLKWRSELKGAATVQSTSAFPRQRLQRVEQFLATVVVDVELYSCASFPAEPLRVLTRAITYNCFSITLPA